ncbi:MAG: arsenic transporter [Actinobacteria bacterium]|nr:arsenic transporter [Actinomycetota bacterium]
MGLAIGVFVVTLALVIWQPRGLGIGWSALGGAALALVLGVVHLSNIPTVWGIIWNATFTFVAIIIVSLVLDASGFFKWAALHVARIGRGRGRALFVLIVLLGAGIAAIFANDGTALILTPIVMEMLVALDFSPASSFAFVMATGFIADSASMPLVVSNLVNIVSADYFHISFSEYALVMIPVGVASVAASLAVLFVFFRRRIPKTYDVTLVGDPGQAIKDVVTFRAGWVALVVLLAGYFAAAPLGIPISAVAGAGAVALMGIAGRHSINSFFERAITRLRPTQPSNSASIARSRVLAGPLGEDETGDEGGDEAENETGDAVDDKLEERAERGNIDVTRIVKEAPWQIVLFSLGMYLVVYGLRNEGLTTDLARLLDVFGRHGVVTATFGTGTLIAVLSSIMNNMPTVLVGALSIHSASISSSTVHHSMVYANVVGADLGPKITPIGSLATLLWLHVLDRRGMKIGWGTYVRVGIVLTLPVLAATLAVLAGRMLIG